MKTKKFLSLVLAMVMALSLAVPAFASGNTATSQQQSVAITGTTQVPTINIVVPSTGTVVLNPYKMEVTLGSARVTNQIVSATQYVENKSDVPLNVSAAFSVTTGGNAKLSTKSLASDTKTLTNSVYVTLQSQVVDAGTEPASWTGDNVNTIVGAATGKATPVGTLAQGDGTNAGATKGFLAFRLSGDAVASPSTAWATTDTISATIAFTCIPTSQASAGDASVALAIAGTTATATFDAGTSGLTAVSYTWTSGTEATATIAANDPATTATITEVSTNSGDSTDITVVVTLSNGATVTATDTYSIA